MSEAKRIEPDPPTRDPRDAEHLDVWGFADSGFAVNGDGHVTFTGDRYPISGQILSDFLPWARDVLDAPLSGDDVHASGYPTAIPERVVNAAFEAELAAALRVDQIDRDPRARLRHGHGHTQEEMWAIKYGCLARVPDLVVSPESDAQVRAIVALAARHRVCLIPYGGGTNVTEALRCPRDEQRSIASVDMRRMNRVLWIDPENRAACIEAGSNGREIAEVLARHGYTIGHEPDSYEFSTLGGWVATHASGMKKNRYGNIEDILLDVTVVSALGKLERSQVVPRESIGLDPKLWVIGSEGSLGIITSAVVKLFPLPEERRYGSVVFKKFESGLAFMYDLAQKEVYPASVRLVDNLQFQFGQVLKPASKGAKKVKSKVEKWLVTGPLGFDPNEMVAVTLVFEGSKEEVDRQEKLVYALAKRHKGFKGGADNGKRGYMLTFGIAYIRDFVLQHNILGESFETSVPWSQAQDLVDRVKRAIYEAHDERKLPGRPFVSCRVTQIYETGCCIYFYMAFYAKGVADAVGSYHEIESVARKAVIAAGGSISHHHGVGKLRLPFVNDIMSPAMQAWREQMKFALDPQGVFAAQLPLESHDDAAHGLQVAS